MTSFEITTVIVVLAIFGAFTYGAFRAEKAVAAKAKLLQEAHAKTTVKATTTRKK